MCVMEDMYLWVIFVLVFWVSGVVYGVEDVFWVWYYDGCVFVFVGYCGDIVWGIVWVCWIGFGYFVEVIYEVQCYQIFVFKLSQMCVVVYFYLIFVVGDCNWYL